MKYLRNFDNLLLNRKEIEFEMESLSNPGYGKCKSYIATNLKVPEEVIVIKNVLGKFGSHIFTVHAFVYNSVETLKMVEPIVVVKGGKKN